MQAKTREPRPVTQQQSSTKKRLQLHEARVVACHCYLHLHLFLVLLLLHTKALLLPNYKALLTIVRYNNLARRSLQHLPPSKTHHLPQRQHWIQSRLRKHACPHPFPCEATPGRTLFSPQPSSTSPRSGNTFFGDLTITVPISYRKTAVLTTKTLTFRYPIIPIDPSDPINEPGTLLLVH